MPSRTERGAARGSDRRATGWTRAGVALAVGLLLAGCEGSGKGPQPEAPRVAPGPLPSGAVVWALGGTVHVGDREIAAGGRVRAMVQARGRIYYVRSRSDAVLVTDGGTPRRTPWRAEELRVSADGRYLGFLDTSAGLPWSTTVVDLATGETVVHDDTGMGGEADDLADLYEDAEPAVLDFDGDDLLVRSADGRIRSWDARTGAREDLGPDTYVVDRDPGGGLAPLAMVERGRFVVPQDPYDATRRAHVSPDGSVAVLSDSGGSRVFAVGDGRRLRADLGGRTFLLGGWTGDDSAYGLAFDRTAFGPHEVRLVRCRLSLEERRCRVLRTLRPPPHQLVLFPSGSAASDY